MPYKTEPPAVTDLLSGQVHMMISSYSTVAPHIREGKLRALVTTLDSRSPLLPDVPSITEAGMSKFPIVPWAGMFGPARLPPEIVQRLNGEVVAILNRPDVTEQLARQAFAPRDLLARRARHLREGAVRDLGQGDPRGRHPAGVTLSAEDELEPRQLDPGEPRRPRLAGFHRIRVGKRAGRHDLARADRRELRQPGE